MKIADIIIAVAALAATSCAPRRATTADYQVVPLPRSIELSAGEAFRLSTRSVIAVSDSALLTDALIFADNVQRLSGIDARVAAAAPRRNYIRVTLDKASSRPESYSISVTADSIVVSGADAAGVFYGLQTLTKAITPGKDADVLYPAATITDWPRFAYRGGHLDCVRHFFDIDSVKTYIDMLALHNINHFHWHLTDDQGWRIESKRFPLLTEVGSVREGTIIGTTEEYDSIPYGGYYTQEQLRDVVRYAADRHISVIPEVELPGHMMAALTAYPQLGCTGGPYKLWCRWGVTDDILCAGSDSTYTFIDGIIDEICDIFPYGIVHIGGDEAPLGKWKTCPRCQHKIRELRLKTDSRSTAEQKLQNHVMRYAAERLASRGRRIIGWDEIIDNGFDTTAIVMSWRGPADGGQDGARLGYKVIKAPNTHLYFDYQYAEGDTVGAPYWRKIPLDTVYNYNPVPACLTPEQAANVIGVQGNVWTEFIPTFSEVQYMALPRMAALAELQWVEADKDYDAFLRRLARLQDIYAAYGWNFRKEK